MNRRPYLRSVLILAILFIPILGLTLADAPFAQPVAVFGSVIILWFTELLPLPVTGLLVPVLIVLFGVDGPKEAFSPFGNQILFLFIGSFLLAKAMQKHRWDRRMAYWLLSSRIGSTGPGRLTIVIGSVCWVLSMWVSNTATCAMMAPLCIGIIETLSESFEDELARRNFSVRLMLVCAFASSIGGMATPVGSPPNLLALGFLAENGVHVSFVEWMFFGVPVALAMAAVLTLIMCVRYPVRDRSLSEIRIHFKERLEGLGPLTAAELQVAGCFVLAVLLWMLPGLLDLIAPEAQVTASVSGRLPMGGVAVLCAGILFLLPVGPSMNLVWDDARDIDWGTILLFGGGLCLGSMLDRSGLGAALGAQLFASQTQTLFAVGAIAVAISIGMSEFSSNTASTSVIVPILLGTFSSWEGGSLAGLVIAAAFGASFGFMLPVSTPPNAIVYGTGVVPLREMVRTGILFDFAGWALIVLFLLFVFPAVSQL